MIKPAGYVVYSVIAVVIYLFIAYCMQAIAKDLNIRRPWLAWIPVVNVYLWSRIIGKGLWWTILWFVPLVNVVITIIFCFKLARICGKGRLYGLLLLIPIVDFVILWILAFGVESFKLEGSPASTGQDDAGL